MGWVLNTVITIIGALAIAGTVIAVIRLNKMAAKIDIPENASLIDVSTRKQFTNGYSIGLIKEEIPRKNNCTYIEFYPVDSLQGETQPRPELQSVVVANTMLRRFAKGSLSSRREMVKVLSRNPTDIPQELRDTSEGIWMTKEGQFAHLERTFGKAIPAGDDALNEMMIHFARGHISRNILAQLGEENQELQRLLGGMQKEPQEIKKP